jgi:6-phosphogluconolactonase
MAAREIKIFPDVSSLMQDAARRIVAAAAARVADHQHLFSLALSGGNTPKALYELMASEAYRGELNWSKVEIYFGDERSVPPDHPESNYRMANEAMLSKLPIPEPNVHRIRGELQPEPAAIEYGTLLKRKFQDAGPDLALLGMGPDGHTASLFPRTAALAEAHHRCVANWVPQLNTWRVTLTYPFLNNAKSILILIAGEEKAKVLKEVLEGPREIERLPIQGIEARGTTIWLLDSAAASLLDPAIVHPTT